MADDKWVYESLKGVGIASPEAPAAPEKPSLSFRTIADVPTALFHAVEGTKAGLAETVEAGRFALADVTGNEAMRESATKELQGISERRKQRLEAQPYETGAGEIIGGGMESTGYMLPSLATGLVGGPPAVLGTMGARTAVDAYAQKRLEGEDAGNAAAHAATTSVAQTALEVTPFKYLTKILKGGRGADILKYFAAEQLTELPSTTIDSASDIFFTGKDKQKTAGDVGRYLSGETVKGHNWRQEMLDTAGTTLVQSAIMGPAATVPSRYVDARLATQQKKDLSKYDGFTPEMVAQWDTVSPRDFHRRARAFRVMLETEKLSGSGRIYDPATVQQFLTTGFMPDVTQAEVGTVADRPVVKTTDGVQLDLGFAKPSARKALSPKEELARWNAEVATLGRGVQNIVAPPSQQLDLFGDTSASPLPSDSEIETAFGDQLTPAAPTPPPVIAPAPTEQRELKLKQKDTQKATGEKYLKKLKKEVGKLREKVPAWFEETVVAQDAEVGRQLLLDPAERLQRVRGDITQLNDSELVAASMQAAELKTQVPTTSLDKAFYKEQERRVTEGTAGVSVMNAILDRLPATNSTYKATLKQLKQLISHKAKPAAARSEIARTGGFTEAEALAELEAPRAPEKRKKPASVSSELPGTREERSSEEAGPSDRVQPEKEEKTREPIKKLVGEAVVAPRKIEAPNRGTAFTTPSEIIDGQTRAILNRNPREWGELYKRAIADGDMQMVEALEYFATWDVEKWSSPKQEVLETVVSKEVAAAGRTDAVQAMEDAEFDRREKATTKAEENKKKAAGEKKAAPSTPVDKILDKLSKEDASELKSDLKSENGSGVGQMLAVLAQNKKLTNAEAQTVIESIKDPDEKQEALTIFNRKKPLGKFSKKQRAARAEAVATVKEAPKQTAKESRWSKALQAAYISSEAKGKNLTEVQLKELRSKAETISVQEIDYTPTALEAEHMAQVEAKTGSKVIPVRIKAGEAVGVVNGFNTEAGEILYNIDGANATIATIGHEIGHDLQKDKVAWKVFEDATGVKGLEQSADLFGQMVVLSPNYVYNGIARKAQEKGKLGKIFDSMLNALDRALGIGVEDQALMKQLEKSRNAARDAYAKYDKKGVKDGKGSLSKTDQRAVSQGTQGKRQEAAYQAHPLFDHGNLGVYAQWLGNLANLGMQAGYTQEEVRTFLRQEIQGRSIVNPELVPIFKKITGLKGFDQIVSEYPTWKSANEGTIGGSVDVRDLPKKEAPKVALRAEEPVKREGPTEAEIKSLNFELSEEEAAKGKLSTTKPFYSKLTQTIEEKMGGRMHVPALKNMLRNNGVHADEIELLLSGLSDRMDNKDMVSKKDVLDEIAANDVEYVDEILSGKYEELSRQIRALNEEKVELAVAFAEQFGGFVDRPETINRDGYALGPDTDGRWRYILYVEERDFEAKQFSEAIKQLVGKRVTRPILDPITDETIVAEGEIITRSHIDVIESAGIELPAVLRVQFGIEMPAYQYPVLPESLKKQYEKIDEKIDKISEERNAYKKSGGVQFPTYVLPEALSDTYNEMFVTAPMKDVNDLGYWDKKAVIDGTLVLGPEYAAWKDGHTAYDKIKNPIVRLRFNERVVDGKRVLFIEEMQGASPSNQTKMPSFLQKRIYDIGVKRALAYAKDKGFDFVSWTTGEQQAERYNLSTEVESIGWELDRYGDKHARVVPRASGQEAIHFEVKKSGLITASTYAQLNDKTLDEVVGKEFAQRILETPKGSLTGDGLKIGGTGLRNLYNKTLPSLFKKYGKEDAAVLTMKTKEGSAIQLDMEGSRPYRLELRTLVRNNDNLGFDDTQSAMQAILEDGVTGWEWNSPEDQAKAAELRETIQTFTRDQTLTQQLAVPITDKTPAVYGKFSKTRSSEAMRGAQNERDAAELGVSVYRGLKGEAKHKLLKQRINNIYYALGEELEPVPADPRSLTEQFAQPSLPFGKTSITKAAREMVDESINVAGNIYRKAEDVATKAVIAAKDPNTTLSAAQKKTLPTLLKIMPPQEIIRNFAKSIPGLKAYESLEGDYIGASNGAKENIDLLLEKLTNDEQRKAFSKAAAFATTHMVNPERTFEQQDLVRLHKGNVEKYWVSSGMREKTQKTFQQAYTEGKKLYEALGENKKLLLDVSAELDQMWEDKKNATLARVYNSTKDGSQARERLLDLVEQYTKKLPGLYYPLARFGNFFVVADNKTTGEEAVWTFESPFEAQIKIKELMADPNYTNPTTRYRHPRGNAMTKDLATFVDQAGIEMQKVKLGHLEREVARLEAAYKRELTEEERESLAKDLEAETVDMIGELQALYLRHVAESGTLKNVNRREIVEGYNQDMLRAVNDYTERFANDVAKTKYMYQLRELLERMKYRMLEEERSGINRDIEQMVIAQLRDNLQLVENVPQAPAPLSGFAKVASAMYMSSPSVFLMQMSQLGLVTWPRMMALFGTKDATTALSNGMGRAFSPDLSPRSLVQNEEIRRIYKEIYAEKSVADVQKHGGRVGDYVMSEKQRNDRVKKLSELQRHQLLVYTAIGTTFAYDVGQEARGQKGTGAFNAMMFFMRQGEEKSRLAALLAGYELYTKNGASWDSAIENTRFHITNETLFDYSPAGRPYAQLKYPSVKIATQFRFFQLMYLSRTLRLLLESTKSPEARREIAGMWMSSMVLAGVAGTLPFALIDMIWKLVVGDDDEEFVSSAQSLRNWATSSMGGGIASDVFQYGVFGAVGSDISGRIGASDTLGVAEDISPVHLKGSAKADQFATRWLLGPSWGVVRDVAKAIDKAGQGEYAAALRVGTPKLARDVFKAMETVEKGGIFTSAGERLTEGQPLSPWELTLLATGHNPMDYAEPREARYSEQQLSARLSDYKGQLVKKFADAYLSNDYEGQREALQDIQDFRAKHPAFGEFNLGSAILERRKKEIGYRTASQRRVAAARAEI